TLASGMSCPLGANQWRMCSALLQASKTVSRRAWSMRERWSGGYSAVCVVPFASIASAMVVSFVFERVEIGIQPVQAAVPFLPAVIDPLLGLGERACLHRAGANASYF